MLKLFETHCSIDADFTNDFVLYAVMRLLREDTPEIAYHLPRLVQLVQDALTEVKWQGMIEDDTRELLSSLMRRGRPSQAVIPALARLGSP